MHEGSGPVACLPPSARMPYFSANPKSLFAVPAVAVACALAALFLPAAAAVADDAPAGGPSPAEALEFFEKHVRPLLVENCLACHGDKREGGLRLDSPGEMAKGGDSGAAIVAGDPAASLLVKAVHYDDEPKMPPKGKLPGEAIASLETWIKLGAPWPEGPAARLTTPTAAETRKNHWAFQPIRDPVPPPVADRAWPRSTVDPFVLAKLEAAGMTPSAPADRRTLIRRASFDVVGLPPTAEEVEAFERDPAPDAFAHLVERLLASPHYGERWGRHWLDVARYADTKGYVFTADRSYPNAWRYRDWVVDALNRDLPYDEFLVQQIAADRLPAGQGSLAAMGFLTVGRRFLNNPHDIIDDRLDVLARGTMALTLTCARCHDHKYDPIPTADYYSLYGVLANSIEPDQPADLMTLADRPEQVEPHIFIRGNSGNPGDTVPRRFLAVLAGDERKPFGPGSGRLELARAIASSDNPLTARAIVNRVWLYYFGAGLVRTPSDFGLRSDPPTHPELLDHLAARLIADDWSLKEIHRLILNSATYQQASLERPECRQVDAENRLLWRMNRKRLDFEALRDALVAAAGARRDAGRPGRRADQGAVESAPRDLRPHRSPEPAQPVSHLRFRQPRRPQPAALRHHRAAASAVFDEQPLRARPDAQAGRPRGVVRRRRSSRANRSPLPRRPGPQADAARNRAGPGVPGRRRGAGRRRGRRGSASGQTRGCLAAAIALGALRASCPAIQRVRLCRLIARNTQTSRSRAASCSPAAAWALAPWRWRNFWAPNALEATARAGEPLNPFAPKAPHFAPRAKRVIHLFMNGGPSHVDTFDPKPELTKYHGQELPVNLPTERKTGAALASPFKFRQYGQSGIEVSELFAHVGESIDEICRDPLDARRRRPTTSRR